MSLLIILSSFPLVFGAIRLAKYNALKEMRESEKYLGFSHPKQLSTGVREVKSVRSHRMVVPEEKFITVLKIINDY